MKLHLFVNSLIILTLFSPSVTAEKWNQYKPVGDLITVASNLNLTSCVEKLRAAAIDKLIEKDKGKFTLFCPIDDAFDREVQYPGQTTLEEKMLNHVVKGKITSNKFRNELTLKTLLPSEQIRINVYTAGPFSTETANGQGIMETDHMASNGVLHVIYSVMDSVYHKGGSVVSQMVQSCPNTTKTLQLIYIAGLYPVLDKTDPITLLVPSNDAWHKLPSGFLDHLINTPSLLQKVLFAHTLPFSWYSAGLSRRDKIKTMFGNKIIIDKDKDGRVYWSGAFTTLNDVTTLNGVIQVIDKVILPKYFLSENEIIEFSKTKRGN